MSEEREAFEERLRERVGYDKDSGAMWWKEKANRNTVVGSMIGRPNSWGHFFFAFMGRTLMVHRVAWFLENGSWPTHQIDHIDGDKSNNRISNLRDVPQNINMQNMKNARKDSKSGLLGVSHRGEGRTKAWRASIKVGKKSITVGSFFTKEEAHAAYLEAKRKLHEGCTL